MKKAMIYTLEQQIQFLREQRTESYIQNGEGAAQRKIGYGAKNSCRVLALPVLGRSGV